MKKQNSTLVFFVTTRVSVSMNMDTDITTSSDTAQDEATAAILAATVSSVLPPPVVPISTTDIPQRSTEDQHDDDTGSHDLTTGIAAVTVTTGTSPSTMEDADVASTSVPVLTIPQQPPTLTMTRSVAVTTTIQPPPVVAISATAPTAAPAAAATNVLENARLEINQMIERNEFNTATNTGTNTTNTGTTGSKSENENDSETVSALQTLFRDYEAVKEKVTKLKTLLGRSAKAQRDGKVELELLHKKYDTIQKENSKLRLKIAKLSIRPTHLDLLADFETNFDRALLSASGKQQQQLLLQQQQQQQQSGGQDTSGATTTATTTALDSSFEKNINNSTNIHTATTTNKANSTVMDNVLLQELSDSKRRIETLEQYNTTLVQRYTQMEQHQTTSKVTISELAQKLSHVELEKKMAYMEVDAMTKQLQHHQSSLSEMQLEIELLSKQKSNSHQQAQSRRSVSTNVTHTVSSDNNPQQLQEKVHALEEWAIASNHAKAIAYDRIRTLEQQLAMKEQQQQHQQESSATGTCTGTSSIDTMSIITDVSDRGGTRDILRHPSADTTDSTVLKTTGSGNKNNSNNERVLDTRRASVVIGAGDVGVVLFELEKDVLKGINTFTQRIVLRWKFDLLQGADAEITFAILKGNCTASAQQRRAADAIIKDRIVKGGAGGEIDENAFSIGRSCTIVWSNKHSWIRPRTVRYILEAIVMDD